MARILVVDDDASMRALVKKILLPDHEVVEAAGGEEALGVCRAHGADIVITDIIMPDRDGIETILEIRDRWPDTRIVAMSGGGAIDPDERLADARLLGADEVLRKPFGTAQLRQTIDYLLTR